MSVKVTELGCAGHLCVSSSCRWRRHTQVGRYRISTVGDYYVEGKRTTLGAGDDSFFESMVFQTKRGPDGDNEGCGCREVKAFTSSDCARYATAGEAQRGHEKLIKKYKELAA